MIHENKCFTDSAQSIAPLLEEDITPVLTHSTLQFNIFWISVQSFVLALVGFNSLLAGFYHLLSLLTTTAVVSSFVTLSVVGGIYAGFVALITCHAQDPLFLQSWNAQLSDSIQNKAIKNNRQPSSP